MRNRLIGEVIAVALAAVCGAAQAVGVSGQGTWETTLQARDLDGDAANGPEAFYDTTLNITWLRNADVYGQMHWNTANTWANTLVVGGIGGWRLPTMIDTGTPGCNFSYAGGTDCGYNVQTENRGTVYSEMAHLWYLTLGNKALCSPGDATCAVSQPGWGLTNTGNFLNLQSGVYWSGTEYAPDPSRAWFFRTVDGGQNAYDKNGVSTLYALAVRDGDVVVSVPEPETYALMLAGLAALALARRQQKR